MKNVLFIVLMVLALLVSGCNEAQRPVYGQGNLPAQWQEMFGKDNGSRLDFIQNQIIVELRDKTIKDMEVRIKALEALVLPKDHSGCKLNKDGLCVTIEGCKVTK